MKKRVVSFVLVALLVMSFLPLCVSADGVTELKTAADIEKLMKGEYPLNGSYKLANDIDISSVSGQKPIGGAGALFVGTFDGQNHKITGVNITASDDKGTGFFGAVGTCTIKNLTIEGKINGDGKQRVGGIIGSLDPALSGAAGAIALTSKDAGNVFLVENCVNNATVTAKTRAGGILGIAVLNNASSSYDFKATIKDCVNNGSITITDERVGGIAGSLSPDNSGNRVFLVTGCTNNGTVSGPKKLNGGIVGNLDSKAGGMIEKCVNNGAVKLEGKDGVSAEGMVGGIVGRTSCWSISKCLNNGSVSMTVATTAANLGSRVGGIAGRVDGDLTVSDCLNLGEVSDVSGIAVGGIAGSDLSGTSNTTVTRCLNKGVIKAAGSASKTGDGIGEVIGISLKLAQFSDCFYLVKGTAHDNGVGGTAYKAADFAKLNAENAWSNEADPVLAGMTPSTPVNPGPSAPTGDNTVVLALVALVSVLALGAVVVTKKQSVR